LQKVGKGIVIPSRRRRTQPRDYAKHLYRARRLVEQFFNKSRQYRSVATRYDKFARSFLGAIQLAATVDRLK
jgi:transposase